MKLGKIPGWIGLILIGSYIVMAVLLIFVEPEKGSAEMVKEMVGLIGTLSGVAAGYHFKNSGGDIETQQKNYG